MDAADPENATTLDVPSVNLTELGLPDIDLSNLTPEELAILEERQKFIHEHAGHEKQHAEMALILLGILFVSQFAIVAWKKYHIRSFNLASLVGLWLLPPLIGYQAGNYRYVFVWFCFSVANTFIVKRAFEIPLKKETPGLVYRWYAWIYSLSYAVGFLGYVVVLLAFFRIPSIFGGWTEDSEVNMFQVS
ncbi:hypothetical protein HK102_006852 [Quaeritorhiza haematococci]|nr:hypothetical protein HK102_006852 [Quaeritorhiza haematococci]